MKGNASEGTTVLTNTNTTKEITADRGCFWVMVNVKSSLSGTYCSVILRKPYVSCQTWKVALVVVIFGDNTNGTKMAASGEKLNWVCVEFEPWSLEQQLSALIIGLTQHPTRMEGELA